MNTTRSSTVVLVLALVLASGAAAPPLTAAALRVAGSDLLGPAGREALTAQVTAAGSEVALNLTGSLPGREALLAGRADIALLVHAPDLENSDNGAPDFADFRRIPVAWIAAIAVVPADNPLTQITYEQLAGVFGVSAGQAVRHWGDLGLADEWAGRAVTPVVIGRGAGLTLDYFVHAVLLDRPLLSGLPEFDNPTAVLEHLAIDRGGIALLPIVPPATSGARALLVTAVAGEVAFGPSAENIANGDYALRLPLELVFRRSAEKSVAPVVLFFAAPAGVAVVETSLLVPLPVADRTRLHGEFGAR